MTETIAYADFERVDIRAGTIVEASPFPRRASPPSRSSSISVPR